MAQPAPLLQKIMVEGRSDVIEENRAIARAKAIDNAMENAFREVLNQLLSDEALIDNLDELEKFITTKSRDYIQSYKVVIEYLDIVENTYKVVLEAAIFKENLVKNLAGRGILFKGRDIHRIIVIIDERKIGEVFSYTDFWANSSIAEGIIKKYIQKRGISALARDDIKGKIDQGVILKAVNGNLKATADIGILNDAEVVVIGSAVSKLDIMQEPMYDKKPLRANIRAKAVRSDTGMVMVMLSDNADTMAIDEAEGSDLVLIRAGQKIADILLDRILESWNK